MVIYKINAEFHRIYYTNSLKIKTILDTNPRKYNETRMYLFEYSISNSNSKYHRSIFKP